MNYFPVTLKSCDDLIKFALAELGDLSSPPVSRRLPLSNSLSSRLNEELHSMGLGSHTTPLAFVRQPNQRPLFKGHVDGPVGPGEPCKVSLVIPVCGETSGYQYWLLGKHNLVQTKNASGVSYYAIDWLELPRLGDILWLQPNQAYVTRSDAPHDAVCIGPTPRVTLTFRLEGNPSFETVVEKFSCYPTSL